MTAKPPLRLTTTAWEARFIFAGIGGLLTILLLRMLVAPLGVLSSPVQRAAFCWACDIATLAWALPGVWVCCYRLYIRALPDPLAVESRGASLAALASVTAYVFLRGVRIPEASVSLGGLLSLVLGGVALWLGSLWLIKARHIQDSRAGAGPGGGGNG